MLTYRRETISEAGAEIVALLPQHLAFAGDPSVKYQPDLARYVDMERERIFHIMTVREDGHLIGYMFAFVRRHLNASSIMTADIATYFVEDRPNRSLVLRRLFTTMINYLERAGIRHITAETACYRSAGRLLEAMGFEPRRIGYQLIRPTPVEIAKELAHA